MTNKKPIGTYRPNKDDPYKQMQAEFQLQKEKKKKFQFGVPLVEIKKDSEKVNDDLYDARRNKKYLK